MCCGMKLLGSTYDGFIIASVAGSLLYILSEPMVAVLAIEEAGTITLFHDD